MEKPQNFPKLMHLVFIELGILNEKSYRTSKFVFDANVSECVCRMCIVYVCVYTLQIALYMIE